MTRSNLTIDYRFNIYYCLNIFLIKKIIIEFNITNFVANSYKKTYKRLDMQMCLEPLLLLSPCTMVVVLGVVVTLVQVAVTQMTVNIVWACFVC